MLLLTRRIDEAIVIGTGIRIVVTGIDRGRVILGVEAPEGVLVLREELVGGDKKRERA